MTASEATGAPAAGLTAGAMHAPGVFVGRDRELAELLAALEQAFAGSGSLFLLAGEPGIGKSRLADELGRRAKEAGARVLWGRCWEAGGAPAYWPWLQSLRSHLRESDPDSIRTQLGSGAPDVAHLLPEVRDHVPDLPPPSSVESEGARFRVFDSTAGFLRRAAEAQPLVLVLDDLQVADTPSLLLLEFVADVLPASRVLLVGAYRDVEVDSDHPLAKTLAALARSPAMRLLTLGGLSRGDIGRYIELATDIAPVEELVGAIHEETEGNPLFVGEVLRLLAAEGRLASPEAAVRFGIPVGIRQVIGRRVRRLSPECAWVLTLASILGREFRLDALARVSELAEEDLLGLLDEAIAARLVTEVPGGLGRLRFAHALIRDALYEELATSKRLQLHRETGEVLERLYELDPEPHLAELAHHFFNAAPGGDVRRAVRFTRLAGDRAARLLAFEEAVRLYGMALQALQLEEPPDERVRCELLLVLGDAQSRVGDRPAAKKTFLEAAAIARKHAWSDQLARAALGYGGRFVWEADRGDANLVPLLEEALSVVSEEPGALRARLVARLAGGPLRDEVVRDRREVLSRAAVEIARAIGDPSTLAWVLDGRHAAVWWPENIDERLAIAGELIRVATVAADKERVFQGHHYRWIALLEKGDVPATYAELEAQTRLAEELRQPAQLAYVSACRGTLAALEGKLEEAEELARQTFDLARRAYGSMAEVWLAVQLYAVRRAQGRLDEVEDLVARSAEHFPSYGVFRCILAHLETELGREREARELFRRLADEDFVFAPPEEWVYGASLLADVAARLGEEDGARSLYELLGPYAGRVGVSAPDDCSGAVSRSLGLLAAALGHFDDAAGHFEQALAMNARIRARPWLAQTQHDYARMLLARDGPGDREQARALLDEGLATARALGMVSLGRKLEELDAPRAAESVFRREGEYWSIAYEGEAFRLRDTKGLRYLAALLASPGRELHALDLIAFGEGRERPADRPTRRELADVRLNPSGVTDAGEIIDAQARVAYERRLVELREELEEATAWNDPERAALAREEIDFLATELAGALGLGGRARRAGSPAERARQSVKKAIKVAVERIGENCPSLARHLEGTIHTGLFCRYGPDPARTVAWRL